MDLVARFEAMDDETAIKHLEKRHADQIGGLRFRSVVPGQPRQLRGGRVPWQLYHARLHRADETEHGHAEA